MNLNKYNTIYWQQFPTFSSKNGKKPKWEFLKYYLNGDNKANGKKNMMKVGWEGSSFSYQENWIYAKMIGESKGSQNIRKNLTNFVSKKFLVLKNRF